MEKLYTISKNKTGSWLKLRLWTPYCNIRLKLKKVGKNHWRRQWHPSPVLLPGKFYGLRRLAGYSPWGRKELDSTEQLTHTHTHIYIWTGLIPVELFQILKDDAVKVLHSICQQIWKTQQWPQDWKRSAFIPIPKKSNAKEFKLPHYCTLLTHQ